MISPHFCIHFTKPFPYFGHYMASEIVLGFLVAGLGSFAFWNTQLHSVATAFLRPTIISLLVSAYQESQLTTQSRCENPTKDRVQCGCGGLQWVHCTLTAGALTLCLGTKKVLEHIFSMCLWFFFFFFTVLALREGESVRAFLWTVSGPWDIGTWHTLFRGLY